MPEARDVGVVMNPWFPQSSWKFITIRRSATFSGMSLLRKSLFVIHRPDLNNEMLHVRLPLEERTLCGHLVTNFRICVKWLLEIPGRLQSLTV